MSDVGPEPQEPWEDERFDRDWGTRKQVYAAFKAGWDIDQGPPPEGADAHSLPPANTTPGEGPHGAFMHNGIEPTDAEPLFSESPSTQVGSDA